MFTLATYPGVHRGTSEHLWEPRSGQGCPGVLQGALGFLGVLFLFLGAFGEELVVDTEVFGHKRVDDRCHQDVIHLMCMFSTAGVMFVSRNAYISVSRCFRSMSQR